MTMSKLAELAGVSVSTVSKAFSGSREISTEKREEIFKIARETGCYDKYCKQAYQGIVVAVICPEFKSRFYTELLSFLDIEIQKHQGTMIVSTSDFQSKREEELLTFFSEYSKVDGIIALALPKNTKKYSIPIVVLGDSEVYDCVTISVEKAIEEAILLLKQNGHERIAFIGDGFARKLQILFENAMKKQGLTIYPELILKDESRFESAGYNTMNQLLAMPDYPTAVMASYDNIAIGAMKSISEHGLKIPEDISVIGFDDIKELPYLDVPLTSVTSYNEDLCQIIVDLLYERIGQADYQSHITKKIKISKQLVIRESVGKAKNKL